MPYYLSHYYTLTYIYTCKYNHIFCIHPFGHCIHAEIGYKMSENVRLATVEQKAAAFAAMNKHFH